MNSADRFLEYLDEISRYLISESGPAAGGADFARLNSGLRAVEELQDLFKHEDRRREARRRHD